MIKALIKGIGKDIVFLGLDKENLKKLKQGDPILIDGEIFGIDKKIFIAYGETLCDIQKEYKLPSVN